MKTVYVVGGDYSVEKTFQDRGYMTVTEATIQGVEVDLVCFTGGSDISPYMYGEENISSHPSPVRDEFEKQVYEAWVGKVPIVGICRGAQLINVMNGGKMIQHVSGHGSGSHAIFDASGTKIGMVNTCHHQVMVMPDNGRGSVLAVSSEGYPEIVYFEKDRAFGVQGHPEWGHQNMEDLFFDGIEQFIWENRNDCA